MRVLILGYFRDEQTGVYLMDSFRRFSSDITAIDTRMIVKDKGMVEGQKFIMNEIKEIPKPPEIILVLKGLEITYDTLVDIKDKYPNAVFCNWFFDKYLGSKPIWETTEFFKTIKLYDYFFCSLKGVADKLNELGLTNAKYLDEACHPIYNGEEYLNSFQIKKYGSDVAFVGSLGYLKQHSNRLKILDKVASEGFNLKVYGQIVCDPSLIPKAVKMSHTGASVINKEHSKVVQASLINLGIDQDTSIELGHSARLYRVLCAGGLYLVNGTKCIGNMFKVNGRGKPITGEEDLVVYFDEFDLIEKLDFLLENDEIRSKIAKNGQKIVLEKHTFTDRISEMIEIFKKDNYKFK